MTFCDLETAGLIQPLGRNVAALSDHLKFGKTIFEHFFQKQAEKNLPYAAALEAGIHANQKQMYCVADDLIPDVARDLFLVRKHIDPPVFVAAMSQVFRPLAVKSVAQLPGKIAIIIIAAIEVQIFGNRLKLREIRQPALAKHKIVLCNLREAVSEVKIEAISHPEIDEMKTVFLGQLHALRMVNRGPVKQTFDPVGFAKLESRIHSASRDHKVVESCYGKPKKLAVPIEFLHKLLLLFHAKISLNFFNMARSFSSFL